MVDGSGACSVLWRNASEAVWGTAPVALFWVALEAPGPWGAKAFTESRMEPSVGASIERRCADHGGRASLIRRPGRHPERAGERTVLIATGLATDAPRLWQGSVDSPQEVLSLPWEALAGDVPHLPGFDPAPPQLLVCTNGSRDACCALLGRGIAERGDGQRPGQVWEASHLAGHRFAPTALVLPAGYSLGYLDASVIVPVLDSAVRHELPWTVPGLRGRVGLPEPAQVVDCHLRATRRASGLALWCIDVVSVSPDAWDVTAVIDGVSIVHRVTRSTGPDARPVSCGKAAEPVVRWTLD
ncbi:MAG TPA: sucrase ferredoxin [Propionibacteriaceae bacterium]|nr:sucrase ferredoxin [Propionibacteriaceae bacterium]